MKWGVIFLGLVMLSLPVIAIEGDRIQVQELDAVNKGNITTFSGFVYDKILYRGISEGVVVEVHCIHGMQENIFTGSTDAESKFNFVVDNIISDQKCVEWDKIWVSIYYESSIYDTPSIYVMKSDSKSGYSALGTANSGTTNMQSDSEDGSLGDGSPGDGSPGDGSPGDGSPDDGSPGDGSPVDRSQPSIVDPVHSPEFSMITVGITIIGGILGLLYLRRKEDG